MDYSFLFFVFGALTILSCFRGEEVGADTSNYIQIYKEILDEKYIDPYSMIRFEPGFLLYLKILSFTSADPQWMVITSSLFIMLSFSRFFSKYSKNIWLSVFLFFCLFFNSSMTAIRQYMAISILFFAFEAVLKRKMAKFYLFVAIAFLFHYASLIFLIAYPVYNYKISKRKLTNYFKFLPLIAGVAMVAIIPLFGFMQSYGLYTYYSENTKYIEEGVKIATFLNILLYTFLMILPIKAWRIMRNGSAINNSPIDRLCFIFGLICILLLAISIPFNLIDRFTLYFSVYLCLLLPNATAVLSKRVYARRWYFMLICVLSAYYLIINTFRPDWSHVYPYSFY